MMWSCANTRVRSGCCPPTRAAGLAERGGLMQELLIDRGEESGGDEKVNRLRCTSRVIWAFDLVVGFHCRHHVQPVQAGRINTRSHQRARTRRTQRAILGSSVGAVAAEKSSAWSTSTSTSTIWSQHNTSPQLLTLPLHTSPVSCFPFHPHTRLPLIPTRLHLHPYSSTPLNSSRRAASVSAAWCTRDSLLAESIGVWAKHARVVQLAISLS